MLAQALGATVLVVEYDSASFDFRQTPVVDVNAVIGDDVAVAVALRLHESAVVDVDAVGTTRLTTLDASVLAVERSTLDGSPGVTPVAATTRPTSASAPPRSTARTRISVTRFRH